MKTLTRTIIILAAMNLMTTSFATAPNIAEKAAEQTIERQVQVELGQQMQNELEQVEIELAHAEAKRGRAESSELTDTIKALVTNPMMPLITRQSPDNTVLVIPTEQIKTEDLLTINEDMNVMSRIFGKNLSQATLTTTAEQKISSGRWIGDYTLFLRGGNQAIQGLYLQGYGALFLMNVDIPLSPPPDAQEQEEEAPKEGGDPVWQQMRQQMYEPQDSRSRSSRLNARTEEKYDAGKVEALKTTLIQSLKHAANIRALQPDNSVILSVAGSSTAEWPMVLIIRAKKSDIDAFAKGGLDFEKFREVVQIISYPHLGANTSGAIPVEPLY